MNQQLGDRLKELESEIIELRATPITPPAWSKEQLQQMRDRILNNLTFGKGKVATTSPQYKTAAKVLDRFIGFLLYGHNFYDG